MPRITKDVWRQHAPSAQKVTIPRIARSTMLAIVSTWLVTCIAVDSLATELWAVIAP
jgi:hypothetical protein